MGKSNLGEERFEHPSYAVINIGRAQIGGGHKSLFDSPFKHYHIITLEITPAEVVRNLCSDYIMPLGRVPHIRVAMSEIQFAQLVLNANLHSGTPCTVEEIDGRRVPEPPAKNMKKLWAKDVKRGFKDIADAAEKAKNDVDALLKKDRITKGDVKAIHETLYTLSQDLKENMPWMQERFQEAMDKTVATAKGEIEAHLANKINQAGLTAIKGQPLPLDLDSEGPLKKK